METNIYYQLAQTECALDRCKKNLIILGLMGVGYFGGKMLWLECKKAIDARKERDELAEQCDKLKAELDELTKKDAKKSVHCDGHATLSED
jgi:hypothetical protein